MGGNIERRISKGLLTQFLYGNSHVYSAMESHPESDGDYYDLLAPLVHAPWQLVKRQLWYFVAPEEIVLPDHGFKIHISLVSALTEQYLPVIARQLIELQTPFKVLCNARLQDFHNSQSCNRVSCGKFITVYPANIEIFKQCLARLYQATEGAYGPFILSDNAYKNSRCLFYRYGAFTGSGVRDVMGETVARVINAETGETDQRLPYFQLPEGVCDPFAYDAKQAVSSVEEAIENTTQDSDVVSREDESDDSERLNDRYEVLDCLSGHSSKGGVYEAIDHYTGQTVVLKEARPLINQNRKGQQDAVAGLKHEAHILQRLANTGLVPKVVESFDEWQHHFLVLEKLPGQTLAFVDRQFLSQLSHNRSGSDESTGKSHCERDRARIKQFCQWYLTILSHLVDAVQRVHQQQIVIGDIAPQNILLDTDTLAIQLIDFEGAYDVGNNQFYAPVTSMGFSQHKACPQIADDWQAVANVARHMLHPICLYFALNPSAKQGFWQHLLREYSLPQQLESLPELLSQGGEVAQTAIADIQAQLDDFDYEYQGGNDLEGSLLESQLQQIRQHIFSYLDQPVQGTHFPLDYRSLSTNALGVAFGSSGICHFLQQSHRSQDNTYEQKALALCLSSLSDETITQLPPGLYQGLAGIAWVLLVRGESSRAIQLMQQVYDHNTRFDAEDIFFGCAGWGLASLFFYQQLDEAQYLNKAIEAEAFISQKLIERHGRLEYQNIDGYCYSGWMHGNAGIALFYLRLYQATEDSSYLEKGKLLLKGEVERAESDDDQIAWRKDYSELATYPYLRFGSAGIGQVILRYYRYLKSPLLLDLAHQIAQSLKGRFCIYPGQFMGMAGIGDFFLDMYQTTQELSYLDEAHAIARRILLYALPEERGVSYPGEELARISCDLGSGSAGVGLFLQRLRDNGRGKVLFLDF